jgi:hypothetical protein
MIHNILVVIDEDMIGGESHSHQRQASSCKQKQTMSSLQILNVVFALPGMSTCSMQVTLVGSLICQIFLPLVLKDMSWLSMLAITRFFSRLNKSHMWWISLFAGMP